MASYKISYQLFSVARENEQMFIEYFLNNSFSGAGIYYNHCAFIFKGKMVVICKILCRLVNNYDEKAFHL